MRTPKFIVDAVPAIQDMARKGLLDAPESAQLIGETLTRLLHAEDLVKLYFTLEELYDIKAFRDTDIRVKRRREFVDTMAERLFGLEKNYTLEQNDSLD